MRLAKILLLLILPFTLFSCGTIKEGFKNPKKNSSDEFLVEKKLPLAMPPEFYDLPIPQQSDVSEDVDENKIKTLVSKQEINENNEENENLSFEKNILEKIKN